MSLRAHRRPHPALAIACVSLALTAASAAAAAAAPSPHLTSAGWAAFQRLNGSTVTTASSCNQIAGGSTDAEARGFVGLCVDAVGLGDWMGRFVDRCGSWGAGGVDSVLNSANSATKAACATDVAGIATNYSASAAWQRWYVAQLAPGGCQSAFASNGTHEANAAAVASRIAGDLRSGASPNQLDADGRSWGSAVAGLLGAVPFAGFASCRP